MNSNLRGALLALFAFAIFATHDVFLKVLGGTYSPIQILFFAVLFSFPMTLLMLLADKTEANLRPRHPWWTITRTVGTIAAGLCGVYAFSVLPLSQVYAVLFSVPLLITILSVPILREPVRMRRALAVLIGLIGVLIVLQPTGSSLHAGHLAALIAAFGSSLASIIVRKIGQEERSIVLLVIPQMAMFLVTGVMLAFVYQPMPLIDLARVGAVAVLSVAAMRCMISAYNSGDAVVVAPMQYSQIIWATIFGYFLFDETLQATTVLGTVIIILSGVYILIRESKGAGQSQPVLSTSDQRPTLAIRPRIGVMFRLNAKRG